VAFNSGGCILARRHACRPGFGLLLDDKIGAGDHWGEDDGEQQKGSLEHVVIFRRRWKKGKPEF
jgi:hypothetical protein